MRPYPVCLVAYAVGDYFVIKEKPEDVANIAAQHGWIVPAQRNPARRTDP